MFYKPEYRNPIRERRQELSELNVAEASKRVAAQLVYFHPLQDAKKIGHYMPSEGEIDSKYILECAPFRNKEFFLPVLNVEEKTLSFFPHPLKDKLVENKFSILEPDTEGKKAINLENLDIIFVPLVAFDKNCNRLGRGGGYYDRTLANHKNGKKPLLIGLAYEFQKIENIEPQAWDIPMDFIITENEIYERRLRPIK